MLKYRAYDMGNYSALVVVGSDDELWCLKEGGVLELEFESETGEAAIREFEEWCRGGVRCCDDVSIKGDRCTLPSGHAGVHRRDNKAWGYAEI